MKRLILVLAIAATASLSSTAASADDGSECRYFIQRRQECEDSVSLTSFFVMRRPDGNRYPIYGPIPKPPRRWTPPRRACY